MNFSVRCSRSECENGSRSKPTHLCSQDVYAPNGPGVVTLLFPVRSCGNGPASNSNWPYLVTLNS